MQILSVAVILSAAKNLMRSFPRLRGDKLATLLRMTAVVVCLALTGCMGPVNLPEIHRYQLKSHLPICSGHHAGSKTIYVALPQANAPYNTSKMLYSQGCLLAVAPLRCGGELLKCGGFDEIRSFAEHAWVAPAPYMLLTSITQAMRNTRCFKAVASYPTVVQTNYRLETTLLLLQQEFCGKKSRVHIVMDANLINANTQSVVATRCFNVTEPACPGPVGGVVAYQCALDRVLNRLQSFIRSNI